MTWHPGAPGVGSKLRDAQLVADRLTEWNTKIVGGPLIGLGKEYSLYTGNAKFVVADSDPAVRSLWRTADEGRLEVEAEYAKRLWSELLKYYSIADDLVGEAWKHLRFIEKDAIETGRHTAWALCIFAGAIGARRRRNGSGVVNTPYAPKSQKFGGRRDPNWLPSRIASAEKLRASDQWAKGRLAHEPFDDWRNVFDYLADVQVDPCGIALVVDPPYGHEKGQLYDGKWTNTDRDELVERISRFTEVGVRCIAWCGCEEIDVWKTIFGMEWSYRKANTHMKSGGVRKDGIEPNRNAGGGYIGITTG